MQAGIGHPLGARAQELHDGPLGIVPPGPAEPRTHPVAGNGAGHEDDVAVASGHPAPAVRQRVDLQLELLPGAGSLRAAVSIASIVARATGNA